MAEATFEMIPVNSTQIESIGFSAETNQGRARFIAKGNFAGALYEYDDCTQEEANAIINAPSPKTAFDQIWKGIKPYRRIE